MTRHLKLAATILLVTGAMAASAQLISPKIKKEKKQKENVEWLWQYGPPPAEGRENDLVLDPRFRPFLAQYLTAPQTFWGSVKAGYKPLDETALDFLSVPDKVLADDNRYLSITGCVFHFCPSRGLLWVDLGTPHPLVAFAAIDWVKDGRVPSEPQAEYTLWVFANRAIDPEHIPAALTHSVARWTAEPSSGSAIIQRITNAILVDPDGQPHQIPPTTIGANTIPQTQTEQKEKP
ncbi:MAG TPA: hypothetical protein VK627_09845 [Edaphobacter sp.]|nr:hypothetical protein [Edaphobacter sp.]